MALQKVQAMKAASMTDLRKEPGKIIRSLEDGQVAIFDRNKVVAYLNHPSQMIERNYSYLPKGVVKEVFAKRKSEVQSVLDYLKDK